MRWYINELSLQGQFETGEAFLCELQKVALVRWKLKEKASQLFCTRRVWQQPVTDGMHVFEAVTRIRDKNKKNLILGWLSKAGPFVEDDRQDEPDDYFEFEGEDVTDSGLGEAARRERVLDPSGVFSFTGGQIDFARTPLNVLHGIPEDRLGNINIQNLWDIEELQSRLSENRVPAGSWEALLEVCRERFDCLDISNDILKRSLRQEPFRHGVAEDVQCRLNVLQQVMTGRSVSDGSMTKNANDLWKQHSQGDRAWFSDESESNKHKFSKEMTFADPSDPSRPLFCPWHGKINQETFRIHFEWPVPLGQARLKILYIGRKITRH